MILHLGRISPTVASADAIKRDHVWWNSLHYYRWIMHFFNHYFFFFSSNSDTILCGCWIWSSNSLNEQGIKADHYYVNNIINIIWHTFYHEHKHKWEGWIFVMPLFLFHKKKICMYIIIFYLYLIPQKLQFLRKPSVQTGWNKSGW